MKLLILGATGPTGQQLVKQALERGHDVTAFVRNPDKLGSAHIRLSVFKGDALVKHNLSAAVEGQDAVICALGVGKSFKSNDLMSRATDNLLPAMQEKNVNRLIFTSAIGVGDTRDKTTFLQRLLFGLLLGDIYADKEKAEQKVKQSELQWTIVCPVMLTNGKHSGKYFAGEEIKMTGMPTVARADVAHFMLDELDNNQYVKKTVVVK